MLHIALCDDNISDLNNEEKILTDVLKQKSVEYEIKTFLSPEELLASETSFNLAVLDIEMEHMNGIELAKQLQKKHKNCSVFFITNYDMYLDYAFDVNAVRFFTKPVSLTRLNRAIDIVINKIQESNKKIKLRNFRNKIIAELDISSIIYIANTGRRTRVVSTNYDFETDEIFSVVKNKIEKEVHYFAMPHQSYYVNLKYVKSYNRSEVIMRHTEYEYNAIMTRRRYNSFDEKMFTLAKELV